MKPTLAKEFSEHKHKLNYPVIVSPKLDGVRAILRRAQPEDMTAGAKGVPVLDDGQLHFFSRNNKMWKDSVVAHILEPLRESIPSDSGLILDGEFYKHGWGFNRITGAVAVARKEPSEETPLLQYHVFDAAGCVSQYTYDNRMFAAAQALSSFPADCAGAVRLVGWRIAQDYDDILNIHMEYIGQNGFEGSMVRTFDSPYIEKRTDQLLKVKTWTDGEYEIVGFVEGRDTDKGGRHVGRLGAIVLSDDSGRTFQCGSGFDDNLRNRIWSNRDRYLGAYVTVKYFEITPDGVPRFPIFVGIRDYE